MSDDKQESRSQKPDDAQDRRPQGAPIPPDRDSSSKGDKQKSEIERKADELMTPDPYPEDPDAGKGKRPSFSSPAAMVGWFLLGFFFGLVGLLITLIVVWHSDRKVRSRAITYSCLGILTEVILGAIAFSLLGVSPDTVNSLTGSISSSSSSVW
jgi:hypothetical protein